MSAPPPHAISVNERNDDQGKEEQDDDTELGFEITNLSNHSVLILGQEFSVVGSSLDAENNAAHSRPASKERASSAGQEGPGALFVGERAPDLNIRLFRTSANRSPSQRERRRAQREREILAQDAAGPSLATISEAPAASEAVSDAPVTPGDEPPEPHRLSMSSLGRQLSVTAIVRTITRTLDSGKDVILSASVVEEEQVFEAQRLDFWNRKTKILACFPCLMFLLTALLLSLFLVVLDQRDSHSKQSTLVFVMPSSAPSTFPSFSPSFDSQPTLQTVRNRGQLRCGLSSATNAYKNTSGIAYSNGFTFDLCRAVAATVLGNPDSVDIVPVTSSDRFTNLHDRNIDVLIRGDTHTLEREVMERTTGTGFAFTTPYQYDGMTFAGNKTFVDCAINKKRYDECIHLSICVMSSTTSLKFVKENFPPSFLHVGPTIHQLFDMILNQTCNVIAADWFVIAMTQQGLSLALDDFFIGSGRFTKEPLAMVTRNNDKEWSDITNWVLQALFYGEENGLKQNSSLCLNEISLPWSNLSNTNFLQAVYCVGNYGEIFNKHLGGTGRSIINTINTGSTGMMYAIPFGNIEDIDFDDNTNSDLGYHGTLEIIFERGSLNCGYFTEYSNTPSESNPLTGVAVDYCRSLTAAIFQGNYKAVNLVPFACSNNSSYAALANGTIDILAGGIVNFGYDFDDALAVGNFAFSTPFFYGNGRVGGIDKVFAFVTREDDVQFTSFVNTVVLATIYAAEHEIAAERREKMPLMPLFGPNFRWMMRDTIAQNGNYFDIYANNFEVQMKDRGRNQINDGSTPMLHSLPGLEH